MRKGLSRTALCAIAVLALVPPASASDDNETRRIMHRVLEAMQHLIPLSVSDSGFDAPDRAEAARWIGVLVDATDTLQHHQAPRVEASRYLSRSLADDARTLEASFAQGETLKAQFYVLALTDNCVACHSRLPKNRDFPMSDALFDAGAKPALDPRARIRLLVATRQFDAALAAWEALLADTSRPPVAMDHTGGLDDYLTVAIRVQRDPARAKRTLEAFAKRSTLPLYLREDVAAWIASLTRMIAEPQPQPSLPATRVLVARSDAIAEFPNDRRGRIYDLAASSLLHRLIAEPPADFPDRDLAEALYLLGRIEARGPSGRWVSETESHLESAIRIAPAESFAPQAYSILEQYTQLEYGGASGGRIPEDRQALLDELAALVGSPAAQEPTSPARPHREH